MALRREELSLFRQVVEECCRPLTFFDDDCDGVSSFLQVYRFKGEGRGVMVKDSPELDSRYARKVREYHPDVVFVLDKPLVSDGFLSKVSQRVVWLDHHEPSAARGATYLNPRLSDNSDNRPTSYWVYKALKKDLWLAMIGIVADWHFPEDLVPAFRKQYPNLLPERVKDAPSALFNSRLGELIRILSFNFKGTFTSAMTSVKVLSRVESPYDVLEQSTSAGRYLFKKHARLREKYEELLKSVKVSDEELLVFTYEDPVDSLTSDLSNELLYAHPEKLIIVGRVDNGFVKCSLRSGKFKVAPLLQKCLEEVNGTGGGHTYACGACIPAEEFDSFLNCFRRELKKL